MKIQTHLPAEVHRITYVKNHHWIELEDSKGNRTKLNASGVLIGTCEECKEKNVALTHQGQMKCTYCGGAVKWAWNKTQLAFIPEHESQFMGADIARNYKKK